jgi:cobaltochelatase CobT
VFKQRRKGQDLDTYVELVVDHSGSMRGEPIKLAAETCLVLAEALDKAKIPFGICGFTALWDDIGIDPAHKESLRTVKSKILSSWVSSTREAEGFDRLEPLIEYTYKKADEPYSKIKPFLPLMTHQQMGNNLDGDSILRIAKRISKRREKRKVMIVMSDGCPAGASGTDYETHERRMTHVSKMLKVTPDIDVIGIGIMDESVRKYYDRVFVIDSLNELPIAAMKELKQALMP